MRGSGPQGDIALTSVERLQFLDVTLAFDYDGAAGQVFRLYHAAFDRLPDLPGMGYQLHALESSLTLSQLAANFLASPEFWSLYGTLDDAQFVQQLYFNVLGRAGEQEGVAFHAARLAGGASRADVVLGFSESPELVSLLMGVAHEGMPYVG
jgi:serralysin